MLWCFTDSIEWNMINGKKTWILFFIGFWLLAHLFCIQNILLKYCTVYLYFLYSNIGCPYRQQPTFVFYGILLKVGGIVLPELLKHLSLLLYFVTKFNWKENKIESLLNLKFQTFLYPPNPYCIQFLLYFTNQYHDTKNSLGSLNIEFVVVVSNNSFTSFFPCFLN